MPKVGKNRDAIFYKNFEPTAADRWACKHCKWERTKNVTEMKKHLPKCPAINQKATDDSTSTDLSSCTTLTPSCTSSLRQTTIFSSRGFSTTSTSEREQEALELLLTKFVVMSGSPFNIVEDEDFHRFVKRLCPSFKVPSCPTVSGPLLDQLYTETRNQVDTVLSGFGNDFQLNITIDESQNRAGDRTINFSITHDTFGSLMIQTRPAPRTATLDAKFLLEYVREVLQDTIGGQMRRVNSLSTDTCSSMRKLWRLIGEDPELRHILCIPCQAHSLALLIKDILAMPRFKHHFDLFKDLIRDIRSSSKVMSEIRLRQRERYGKTRVLVASVETRWGSHVGSLNSLKANKEAIQDFFQDQLDDITIGDAVKRRLLEYQSKILGTELWRELDRTIAIIGPVSKLLVQTESTRLDIGTVIERWAALRKAISGVGFQERDPILHAELDRVVQKRYNQQVGIPLHHLAYHLHPSHRTAQISPEDFTSMYEFVKKMFCHEEQDAQAFCDEFYSYKSPDTAFAKNAFLMRREADPILYWRCAGGMFQMKWLSSIALRVFSAPSSSVPSERSFSIQNFLVDSKWARLDALRVDKMMYIYMNKRALRLARTMKRDGTKMVLPSQDEIMGRMEEDTLYSQMAMEEMI